MDESAPTQQAPLKLHEETWAGLLQNQGLRISQEVEIAPGCAVSVARPACPDNSLQCHLGLEELLGTRWTGHLRRKQWGLVYGCFGLPSKGRISVLPFALYETG